MTAGRIHWLIATTVALVLTACGSGEAKTTMDANEANRGQQPSGRAQAQAEEICVSFQRASGGLGTGGTKDVLERAEMTTAASIAEWQVRRVSPDAPVQPEVSDFAALAADEPFAVCLFSGEYPTPGPPGAAAHTKLRVIVGMDGRGRVDAAGTDRPESLAPEMPSDLEAWLTSGSRHAGD
jgi:hypothetical protein